MARLTHICPPEIGNGCNKKLISLIVAEPEMGQVNPKFFPRKGVLKSV